MLDFVGTLAATPNTGNVLQELCNILHNEQEAVRIYCENILALKETIAHLPFGVNFNLNQEEIDRIFDFLVGDNFAGTA